MDDKIESLTAYKTTDGAVFPLWKDASAHQARLDSGVSLHVNWTLDGIDFVGYPDDLPLIWGDDEKLAEWCRLHEAIIFPWNSRFEHAPCYSEAMMLAKAKGVKRVVMVGFHSETPEWQKEKPTTP